VPHPILTDVETKLKGTALFGATKYRWDFGDGEPPTALQTVTNPYDVSVVHTYHGEVGELFLATLTVMTAAGTSSAVYPMRIEDSAQTPSPLVAIAIDEGLWSLHTELTRGSYSPGSPGYGQPYAGFFRAAGIGDECAAAAAFLRHGSLVAGASQFDPYDDNVARLVNFIWPNMNATAANPGFDQNGNGVAVGFGPLDMGPCTETLAQLGPSFVAGTGPTGVHGRSIGDMAPDLVDYTLPQQQGDGSWGEDIFWTFGAAVALTDVQKLGASVSSQALARLASWSQGQRSAAAVAPSCGSWSGDGFWDFYATAAGLFELFVTGTSTAGPIFGSGLGYLNANWGAVTTCASNTYASHLVLRAASVSLLSPSTCEGTITGAGFDWYANQRPPLGMAQSLVSTQLPDGSWVDPCGELDAAQTTAENVAILIGP
jgi:hypothetical protein